jgi:tetratricopeptide (TPR) repeat protein
MSRVVLVLMLSCAGAPPPREEAVIAPPTCPEGSVWNGSLCQRTAPTSPAPTQPTSTSTAPPPTGWNPPPPRPEDVTAARQHFAQGAKLYSAGDFTAALTEFETAYAYKAAAPVLFNIGVTLEHLGRDDEALDVYERFLATNPPQASDVQKKIDALKLKHKP